MLAKLLTRKKSISSLPMQADSKYLKSKSGCDLLASNDRQASIKKIKRSFSVTETVWEDHYSYAIKKFAELAQELPASEIHHHSRAGGLIDHTLEAVFSGVRVAQGYILPPNSEAEKISASSDRWRFGVFISILAHDLGKIVTDIEVVTRENPDEPFQRWHPWFGIIPEGHEYTFRYRDRLKVSRIEKSLHEKATMSLLPKLLTEKATFWLFEDYELIGQVFNTLSHATFGGGVIAEIVRKADSSSVSKNLGADTGVDSTYSKNIPLHEKVITALRYLIQEGELKRNKPGAALWICGNETWVVSKPAIEAAQAKLKNEGHKGIPSNVVRIYETLREHDLIIPTPESNSIWTGAIEDHSTGWEMKLTFLRFKNEVLWPNKEPDQFNGVITPIDKDGNPIPEGEGRAAAENVTNLPVEEEKLTKPIENKQEEPEKRTSEKKRPEEKKEIDPKPTKRKELNAPAETQKTKDRTNKKSASSLHSFFSWVLKDIEAKKIRVSESEALVHVLEKEIAFVTPALFIKYLERNPLQSSHYKNLAGKGPGYRVLQREIEALGINQKSIRGQNIHTVYVEGPNKQSTIKTYLFDRQHFPELKNFSPNKALRKKD